MINLTEGEIVFNRTGSVLEADIRAALRESANGLLDAHGVKNIDYNRITTKTNLRLAFVKFVNLSVLVVSGKKLNKYYVEAVFDAYRQKSGCMTEAQFSRVMFPAASGSLAYKRSYAKALRPGLGMFLVALHSCGAITLPAIFVWPTVIVGPNRNGKGKQVDAGRKLASELLTFIRRIDAQSTLLPHKAFEVIGQHPARRRWLLTYGTRLLIATGWHRAEDVNVDDLLEIRLSESIDPTGNISYTARVVLDILRSAFGKRVSVTAEDWALALRARGPIVERTKKKGKGLSRLLTLGPRSDDDLLDDLLDARSTWGKPESIRTIERLPGLGINLKEVSEGWLNLEDVFVRKINAESYRAIQVSMGWWNIYLFLYLPYWFARNPSAKITYPTSPSLLLKTIFVSRIVPLEWEVPLTFVEFMNRVCERKKWGNNSYYSILLKLQRFFEFIELYSEEIPGCKGFTQPFAPHDYPKTSRSRATRKQPVPRRFFGVYLDYHEALIAHLHVVGARMLSGEISADDIARLDKYNFIDTFCTADLVGFVPIVFVGNKTVPLQFIPNVLDVRKRVLKDGRSIPFPHPHALYQNLVALHTGVRHNHIQWLDRDKFDSLVDGGDEDFSLLYVNTDKVKTRPWTPYVSMRVIEILRAQRQWVELMGGEGFGLFQFYNNNSSTKWPKFRPLFSYTQEGLPHSDTVYAEVWHRTLCGLQGLLPELENSGPNPRLFNLLPPGHRASDPDLKKKLREYGAKFGAGQNCPLNVMTDITPHSARVAVVSQYITFLPADLIGKYITGQMRAAVSYYVHLDKEVVEAEQVHQAAHLRYAVLRHALEPALGRPKDSSAFVHADGVNSSLARGLRGNIEETLASHGCFSIAFSQRSQTGIDVLRKTRGADAAANKTEICPYGNHCPPEIIKDLNGEHRCSLCDYAVRSIDHLPAVVARKRKMAEEVDELEALLSADEIASNTKYTPVELERLEAERTRLCEELAGWILSEELLEMARRNIVSGSDDRRWIVQKPEIIVRDLHRVVVATSMTEYLISRLGECIAYPTMESPQIRARFDLLRRELLARAGDLRTAFSSDVPIDPAAECAGLLKSIIASTGMNAVQLIDFLENDVHLRSLPGTSLRLIDEEGSVDEESNGSAE
ncbi:hypothetical protein [Burkholderia multivorans]|uniref:hypothetical protein n=1 Tax=Burkholderia multivorans TaxID=87883 RepID=UPI00201A1E07|nr:hypothetical protein [Burkholderia multivorans]MCO1367067.1 hypothetical protein [Burkholderia multivorans]MCO1376676.1 hypothetical protein [Burkholderia multivorans]UQP18628.1 hypothetical protein L0Y98_10145 [Burkholderia multivorans]UQP86597.1 hypothetical protein L0Y91_10115 [Burkholderia multivorans]